MRFAPLAALSLCATLSATALFAQERPKAILVLDASGSMWGQIDGTAKITIAQEVVGNLLGELPETQELGLTVYGHRRKGDCSDIETLVLPGPDTRGAITSAVNGLSPRGKTPLSAAVIQAAEALKYTEEKATVILVSDGIETCDFDPCEVGRQLESTGVDFTTHVIGFDVAKPEERAQLQCLAEETGGVFKTAANALELGEAMLEITDLEPEPEPEPLPVQVTFRATDGEDGPVIDSDLLWSLSGKDGTAIVENELVAGFTQGLVFGEYTVEVLRPADEAFAEMAFGVGDADKTVTVALPEFRPAATIEAADTAVAGETIDVRWTGPNAERDYVAVFPAGEKNYAHYVYTREGPLLKLMMPPTPGAYEIRYILDDGRKVLATKPIEITPVTATLTPPTSLPAGSKVQVDWTGPDYDRDFIAVSKPDDAKGYETWVYTREGTPASLQLPSEPGAYELRYFMDNKKTIIARQAIQVAAVSASITPPAALPAGSKVAVEWTGPDDDRDFIAVFARGETKRYDTWVYTRDGSPAQLQLPSEPGEYDIAYVQDQGRKQLVVVPVTIAAVSASITPPADLPAGSKVAVEWTGPDDDRDFIAIFERGEAKRYQNYAYTRDGSPAQLQLPAAPGEYDIAYVQDQGRKQLSIAQVTVSPVSATIADPGPLLQGAQAKVEWTGPNDDRDFIAVFPRGEEKRYLTYAYTRDGSPATIEMPAEPGDYDIAYVQDADRYVLTRIPVTVAASIATITLAGDAKAGGNLAVIWEGPDNQRDYIAITPRGEENYLSYTYTDQGSPLIVKLPDAPGEYDVVYKLAAGNTTITRVPVTVE